MRAADYILLLGLTLLGAGLNFQYSWPIALIVCGSIISVIGFLGVIKLVH